MGKENPENNAVRIGEIVAERSRIEGIWQQHDEAERAGKRKRQKRLYREAVSAELALVHEVVKLIGAGKVDPKEAAVAALGTLSLGTREEFPGGGEAKRGELMAETIAIHIPAEHVPWFREHAAGEFRCDLEAMTPDSGKLSEVDLDEIVGQVKRVGELLSKIGFPGTTTTHHGDAVEVRIDPGYAAYLLDQGLGELAEDMAVASGEYPSHPLDTEKVSKVSRRGTWLATVRESIDAEPARAVVDEGVFS